MTPELYTKHRNELLALLEESIKVGVPEPYAGVLQNTHRKCLEDQFEIALIGEFQGGKSTTFNAMCGGREISPRGLGGGGIKTSAAVVTAQNIADPNETKDGMSEWAEVTWRSNEDLLLSIAPVVRSQLLENDSFRRLFPEFKSDDEFEVMLRGDDFFVQSIKMENRGHQKALQQAIHAEWENYSKDRGAYDPDKLDQLRIATLQLRFVNSGEIEKLREKKAVPIEDFQKWIAFPRDWAQRWIGGENADFNFFDVAFVFIARVLVRIRAVNLSRLGCRITDCPGLFANSWDTQVARSVMAQADAIWYLFNGARMIGESDKKVVKLIQDNGYEHKMRSTVNLRGSHERIIEDIIPVDVAELKSIGFEEPKLEPYNARLAFLAMQGELLLNRPLEFSDYDKYCLSFEYDRKAEWKQIDAKKAWEKLLQKAIPPTDVKALEDADSLDLKTCELVRKESRFDNILDPLERAVINKKAESILIENGSKKVVIALQKYEGDLKAKEAAAQQKEKDWERTTAVETEKLNDFKIKCEFEITNSPLQDQDRDAKWSEELIKKAVAGKKFRDKVITEMKEGLEKIVYSFYFSEKKRKDSVMELLTDTLTQEYPNHLNATLESWNNDSGSSNCYSDFIKNVNLLRTRIENRWEEIDKKEMLKGLPPISFDQTAITGQLESLSNNVANAFSFNKSISTMVWSFCTTFFESVVSIFNGKPFENMFLKGLLNNVDKRLEEAFNSIAVRERLVDGVQPFFKDIREKKLLEFQTGIDQLKAGYDKRCDECREQFAFAQEKRMEIAEGNKKIRTEQIEPLRIRIQAFEKKARHAL